MSAPAASAPDDLVSVTRENFRTMLLGQLIFFIGGLILECLYFRWYNLVCAAIGLGTTALGFFGDRHRNITFLRVSIAAQLFGTVFLFCGTMYTFYSLSQFNNNPDCGHGSVPTTACPDAVVFVVAAAAAPFLFVCFTLGFIYTRRLMNLYDFERTGSVPQLHLDSVDVAEPLAETSQLSYRRHDDGDAPLQSIQRPLL
jgi:hypothetical protein